MKIIYKAKAPQFITPKDVGEGDAVRITQRGWSLPEALYICTNVDRGNNKVWFLCFNADIPKPYYCYFRIDSDTEMRRVAVTEMKVEEV